MPIFVAAGSEPAPAAAETIGGVIRSTLATSPSWGWPTSAPPPPPDALSREEAPRVLVAGVVTHRQRPATAGGTIFINLEDETGLVNVVVSKGCWSRHRRVATSAPALIVRGRLERAEGVTNVIAERMWVLDLQTPAKSRDFR
jgi:DNA polymerase III alpha subunit